VNNEKTKTFGSKITHKTDYKNEEASLKAYKDRLQAMIEEVN